MHDALYLDRRRLRSGCFSRRREDVQDEINDGNNKQEGEGTRGEAKRFVVEDSVNVRVDRNTLVFGREEFVVPVIAVGWAGEFVTDYNKKRRFGRVTTVRVSYNFVCSPVEVHHYVSVCDGFVEQFESSNRVLVLSKAELPRHSLKDVDRALNVGCVTGPLANTTTSTVVIPVLAARCGVKINKNLKVVFPTPKSSLLQKIPLVQLEEWFIRTYLERPITNRDTNMVQPGSCDLSNIVLSNESV